MTNGNKDYSKTSRPEVRSLTEEELLELRKIFPMKKVAPPEVARPSGLLMASLAIALGLSVGFAAGFISQKALMNIHHAIMSTK